MNRRKKEVSIVGIAILLLAAGSVSIARYNGGTGEPNDPYRIATPNDLEMVPFFQFFLKVGKARDVSDNQDCPRELAATIQQWRTGNHNDQFVTMSVTTFDSVFLDCLSTYQSFLQHLMTCPIAFTHAIAERLTR